MIKTRTNRVHGAKRKLLLAERVLQRKICSELRDGKTLRYLERLYGVSFGTIKRISEGEFPVSDSLRRTLGLPLLRMKPERLPFIDRLVAALSPGEAACIYIIYKELRDR